MSLALSPIEWRGTKLNLDSPGYADFIGDVQAALRAADACLFVVSAVDGVEVQHEVVWELAVEAGCPGPSSSTRSTVNERRSSGPWSSSSRPSVPRSPPSSSPSARSTSSRGSPISCPARRTAILRAQGPGGRVAGRHRREGRPYREKLTEAVAEADDSLLEKYLEEGELAEQEVVAGVKAGLADAKFAPVLCGSASRAIGADRLAELMVDAFPSPADRSPVTAITKDGQEEQRSFDPNGPLTAFVFKTISTRTSAGSACSGCSAARSGPTPPCTTPPRAPTSASASCSPCGARITRTSRSPRATSAAWPS